MQRIALLCTSHDFLSPDQRTGQRTGLWLEEFVVPRSIFREAGLQLTVLSPRGKEVPIDTRSLSGVDTRAHADALAELLETQAVAQADPEGFNAVFVPGGHGPMFDLASDEAVTRFLEGVAHRGGVVAAVCHGPAALVALRTPEGRPWVEGRAVTSFSNDEEEQTGAGPALPFLLQSKLEELGGRYTSAAPWAEHVVVDGKLVTGQNPASSAATARAVLEALR